MKTSEYTIKVDLHVHSPASIDYVGNKTERGYAELVKAFVDEEVDAIAITDHNTINGYIEYRRQVAAAKEAYRLMAARDSNSAVVNDLKCEVERFARLHVFPGVEITAYPNIHVILLFDESVVDQVTDFLTNDLGLGEAVHHGDPKKCSKQSVVMLLELAAVRFGDRFLCILPHVETSKGAWEELGNGAARVELFRDERVVAAQFSNPDTVKHISQTVADKNYKRKAPLGFIQCSDYHGDPNIKPASQFSMLKGGEPLDFDTLKNVLTDPVGVRCSHEFVEERLEQFVKGRPQVIFEFINKLETDGARRKDLARALCGILNSGNSVIRLNLFNITEVGNRSAEFISKLFEDLQNDLDPKDGFDFTIAQFHQSTSRQRFCISIDRNSKLRLLDDICWVVKGPVPQPAPAWRIEQIVAQAHYLRVGKNKQEALESASTHLIRVSNAFPAMPIAARLEPLLSRNKCGAFDLKVIAPTFPPSLKDHLGCINGYIEGDFLQIRPDLNLKGGRQNDQKDYFRFSAPTYKLHNRKLEEGESVESNCAIVFPEGGAIYTSAKLPIFAPFPVCEAKLKDSHDLEPKAKEEMSLGLTAWLKSSFLLWYLNSVYQTDDVFEIIIRRRRVPLTSDDNFIRSLSVFGQNIITAEHAVLSATAKENPSAADRSQIMEVLKNHNKSVRINMRQIDREIFQHLYFSADEVREVYRVLRTLDLYDYEISSDLESFLEGFSVK
jgi:histidinol phosphatase-like PHP family hydrolase